MKLLIVLGTRPQIIKSTPIINVAMQDVEIDLNVVHTGQHYDYELSNIFYNEMNVTAPSHNLNVGSGTHGWQTGTMLIELEKTMADLEPDCVLVPGDTNSTLAGALTAAKLRIRLAHVESGARSYDMEMPEEVNRRLTDHCSDFLFTVTRNCMENLLKEGIPKERIFLVGDTMYDVLLSQMPVIRENEFLNKNNLDEEEYAVITAHRQENVDNENNLREIVKALISLVDIDIVFPIHPRTRKRLTQMNLLTMLEKAKHVRLFSPLGYHDMIKLVKNSKMLLTDSGGMQKEAFWLKTRCITLRDTTEWVETIELGVNKLVGADSTSIINEVNKILYQGSNESLFKGNPYGDGKASENIIKIIKES